jgi:glycerophosphoryl diester phosphodiesterase
VRNFLRYGAPLLASVLVLSACSGSDGKSADEPAATTTTTVVKPEATTVAEVKAMTRPIVLAHAGGENVHPHSTPFGYADSVSDGVDVLDFDVQLSKDGVLVIQHDDTVDRTTNTTGKVADMTYAELNALDNAYFFTEDCTCKDAPAADYIYRGVRTGEKPPPAGYTADDFIIPKFEDIAKKYPDFMLNIEIKGKFPAAVPAAKELARILTELKAEDRAVVTAFDDKLSEAFHKELPSVEITPGLTAMTAYVLGGVLPEDGRNVVQIPPDYEGIELLTPEFLKRAKKDGMILWIWPNEKKWENAAGYKKLLDMGVEGINAADPETAVKTVRAFGELKK